ncbi:hypothetical protein DPMN_030742 [Dreissena polymorpha]|uniref:Uncharacterized protein n=1 Tax=Dreissena polymorpha TaxID=45954 RepID=A0A9D4M370_DREPO|nr:hypothetical protein DPMN_030742 [Dreissena polymorpha]
MSSLEETYQEVHRKVVNGFNVVRMSNQCWAGLSGDLVNRQTLMRSRRNAKPLDSICSYNIRVQQCDARFYTPGIYNKSTTQRLN